MNSDWLGWIATAVFLSSYRCKDQRTLRRVQAAAAGLWVVYGAMVHATPVVVANLLVAGIALYSSFIKDARVAPGQHPGVSPSP